ncbi:ammonia-forming cytochrome c nitrite reductase subunit c552 [Ferrimonas senticii]|uniref:ammonia-forming cytochrome c nitrite reductase subunit c552 n=1 Tax=Ferrimonas senticii TaxID=394566 RepID=UPI00041A2602|nr:ammonia-forming cytochrome c nitrite reductase subunit c552 [Ferrimonas senticii]
MNPVVRGLAPLMALVAMGTAAQTLHKPNDGIATTALEQSWAATANNSERHDLLAERPQLIWLYAGSGYDKQFNSPRGHQFAINDVTTIFRTDDGSKTASCWTCKGPGATHEMGLVGEGRFGLHTFGQMGQYMSVSVGCADCHDADGENLQVSRPHALKAMAKIKQPFAEQDRTIQGAQTCGQCHVTYYMQPEIGNGVNIPWIFGSTADDIEKYYDTRQFYDWIHPVSGAPMVKARHPEYEHWSRSAHAEMGVTCVSCHMTTKIDDKGREYTDHNIQQSWQNFEAQCSSCHESEAELKQTIADNKQQINSARAEVEQLLVKAHAEAGALRQDGVQPRDMGAALMGIRHAQWRWDFAVSSHGIHAHNSKEGLDLLAVAKRQATMARARLQLLLEQRPQLKVQYPDLSSKLSAQQAVGLDEAKMQAVKDKFLATEVNGKWPGWSF